MTTHIFLALGMWDEVAASNEASWKASVDRAQRKGLSADAHSFHALSWLGYAYLQQGRYSEARRMLARMEQDAAASGSSKARGHLVAMRAAYLVATGRWGLDAAKIQVKSDDLPMRNLDLFITGLGALETGDAAGARAALEKMSAGVDAARGGAGGHAHGGGAMPYMGGWSSADAVLGKELEARILFRGGGQGPRPDACARSGRRGRRDDLRVRSAGRREARARASGRPAARVQPAGRRAQGIRGGAGPRAEAGGVPARPGPVGNARG